MLGQCLQFSISLTLSFNLKKGKDHQCLRFSFCLTANGLCVQGLCMQFLLWMDYILNIHTWF